MTYGELLVHRVDAEWATNHAEDGKRTHLGASVIGEKCSRAIWFSWLWADKEEFGGRMLRLFERGQRQEEIFAELLRGVGATVWTTDPNTGKQFRITDYGGHFGGSLDGVAINLPDLPFGLRKDLPVLLEFKTHNQRSFDALKKDGLIKSKPKHYKQAQVYMHKMKLNWCLYCAVNKNTDEVWFYFFQYVPSECTKLMARAESIIFGKGIPARISESPSWYECTFCAFKGVCFKTKLPDVNCRTCAYSQALPDGTWRCELDKPEILLSPKIGCSSHSYNSDLC